MSEINTDYPMLRSSFLELFPANCQDECLIAKAAAAKAAHQVIELGTTFEKVSEVLAHRFGRCALGPNTTGRCGEEKSLCGNDYLEGIPDREAVDVLTAL